MLDCFPVEYDFKTLKLDLLDGGELKDEYLGLAYMITPPLNQSPKPAELFLPIKPIYNFIKLKSTRQVNGYLYFDTPQINDERIIINSNGFNLNINYSIYYYDVVINIIKKGDIENIDLRVMSYNIYHDGYASNLNDIYGKQTVYKVNSDKIKFTITGDYGVFFINYPNVNFEISMEVNVSSEKIPEFICYDKENNNCCKFFEINNVGFFKNKKHSKKINCHNYVDIPVYIKENTNGINILLYPNFAKLREIFLNETFNNSILAPVNPVDNINLKTKYSTVVVDFYQHSPYYNFRCKSKDNLYNGFLKKFGKIDHHNNGTLFTTNRLSPENGLLYVHSQNPEDKNEKYWIIEHLVQEQNGYIKYSWKEKNIGGVVSSDPLIAFFSVYADTSGNSAPNWGAVANVKARKILGNNYRYYNLKGGSFWIPIQFKKTYMWIGYEYNQSHFFGQEGECDEPFTITFEYVRSKI